MPPSSVHFNGSVNLPDGETVMQEISSRIPAGVRRMTDGETGERGYWILFQIQKFGAMPEFRSEIGELLSSGRLKRPETVVEGGIEAAPQAFIDMLRGNHLGKVSVEL